MVVPNMPLTKYQLVPYDGDNFYWPANRNAELKQCMWPLLSIGWQKVTFRATNNTIVDQLIWKHDRLGRAEVFQKRNALGQVYQLF